MRLVDPYRIRLLLALVMTLVALGTSLILSASAIAQQADAEVLVAQAALAYNTKRYDEALRFLRQALELDPRNTRALFYKSLTYLAMGEADQAIPPLETLHSLQPTDLGVTYQLAVAYFAAANYDKAAPLLEEVFQRQPDRENLGYYVGFIRYRQKDYPRAAEAFGANQTTDPDIRQLALFYRGLSLGILGLSDQALAELAAAQRVQAMSPITGASVRIQEALAASKGVAETKRFRAQIGIGGYYDDNVAVNPNSNDDPVVQALRSRPTNSPGFLTTLRADYAWYRNGPVEATVSYSYYQTVNTNSGLGTFNIQDHLGGLTGVYRGTVANVPYEVGGQYTYDYMFLGLDGFLSRQTLTFPAVFVPPSFTLPEVGTVQNLTTLLYRYQIKEFFLEPGDNDIRFAPESRDAFNNMIGFLHLFRFAQDRYLVRLGYQYDNEAASGSTFTYTGNRVQTGGEVVLPWHNISVRLDYEVHWRAYRHPQVLFVNDAGALSQRYDIEQDIFLQFAKALSHNFTVALQYQSVRNSSNIPVYDYAKNVFTALVTWTY
ncbi:MAG: tetratricopeptide repeat protein [Nitrospiraceae bacterium]